MRVALRLRLFRLLLRAYPRPFRDRYHADMELLFTERYADAERSGSAAAFCVRTAVSIVRQGLSERIAVARIARTTGLRARSSKMTGVLQDARYAFRLLRRQYAFSAFVVLTLALGIGTTTAVFSVVDGVLLRPLPYQESERLVRVHGRFDPESGFDFPQFPLSIPEYLDYRKYTRTLEDVAAFEPRTVTVGGPGADPERVPSAAVTQNLFSVLRATPAIGRTFSAEEVRPGGAPFVILSHGYWQSRYGGDQSILGQTVRLNGVSVTVIGVMPANFAFPAQNTRMWLPLRIDPANPGNRGGHSTYAVGRLAPGVDIVSARAELQVLMKDWKATYPDMHTGHYLFIRPMLEDVAGDIRPALLLLFGATGFVLLIVCANVASVVLARGEARTREMAIRGALGAGRWRLVRFSLIESAILSLAGGVLAFGLATVLVRGLIAIDPDSVPRATELGPDFRMALFALGVSSLCAALVGLAPAVRGARRAVQTTLREGSLSATATANRLLFRRSLVGIEVALTVMLVLGAGLMLRSFSQLTAVDPGFRPESLVTANLSLPLAQYREPAKVQALFDEVVGRLARQPGVTSASAGSTVPLLNGAGVWDFEVEGRPKPGAGQPALSANAVFVLPGYFETLGVQLVRGRFFTGQDHGSSQPVAVINEALATKFFNGEDPIGRRIRVDGVTGPDAWMSIVGVSAGVRTHGLHVDAPPAYHVLHSQMSRTFEGPARTLSLLVRADKAATDVVMSSIRTAVRELDPTLAVSEIQTAEAVVQQSVARPRFTASLLTMFAAVGLVLGATGIYGVLAYTVARRTQEIGIRRALGAQPGRLARQIVANGMLPVTVGLAAGLLASYWVTRYWSDQLFRVSPTDPLVYTAVAAGVLVTALAAMLVPIRRALRVSPLIALRSE